MDSNSGWNFSVRCPADRWLAAQSDSAQVLPQQNAKLVQRPRAHHFERVPQPDLVGRQHWFSQIVLQPIDNVKRTPVAARQHHRVGFRRVHAAPDIIGGLRIEEADIEIAGQPQRLLREDFDTVCLMNAATL